MNTLAAIQARRSIRAFKPDPVARDLIERILQAGIDAPSAKNLQPWRFVVVTQKERDAMLQAMRVGLEGMEGQNAATDANRMILKGAWNTLRIMEQAPVTVFILSPQGASPFVGLPPLWFLELANIQSVGAAIQNMCLAATELGLGSLWICDVFAAYHPLLQWLGTHDQLVAALSIGYADEAPPARPRRPLDAVTVWR